jgi:diketogulonate reductase-like aldo/keto reductase
MSLSTYNGVSVPSFMYGTAWKKTATTELVRMAVGAGFTAIDTANQLIHYDEALVGDALRALETEGVKRDTLFLQTKFTSKDGQDHRTPYDPAAPLTIQVQQSFESSLQHLGTDYLDSYVLHAPFQRRGLSDADWEVWAAMEELCRSGRTKTIGVSNISAAQLVQLCADAEIKPMFVQNRCFAVLAWDRDVREICRSQNIIYQGFSLLTANRQVLANPEVRAIASRHGAGIPQVIFRFAMEIGMLPLTGTTSLEHMNEDLASVRLSLSEDEMVQVEAAGL